MNSGVFILVVGPGVTAGVCLWLMGSSTHARFLVFFFTLSCQDVCSSVADFRRFCHEVGVPATHLLVKRREKADKSLVDVHTHISFYGISGFRAVHAFQLNSNTRDLGAQSLYPPPTHTHTAVSA
jgi:hypothetical protein